MKTLIPLFLLFAGMQWAAPVHAQSTPPNRPVCDPVDGGNITPPLDGTVACGVVRHCEIDRMTVLSIDQHPNNDKYIMPLHMTLDLDQKVADGEPFRDIKILTIKGDIEHKHMPDELDVELMNAIVRTDGTLIYVDFYVNTDFSDLDMQALTLVGSQPVEPTAKWTYFKPAIKNNHDEFMIRTYDLNGVLTILRTPYLSSEMDVRNVTLSVNNLNNGCGADSQPFDISILFEWLDGAEVFELE